MYVLFALDRVTERTKKQNILQITRKNRILLFCFVMMIAGTPWFFLFKDEITTDLMNALRPDVGVRISQCCCFSR